MLLMLHVTKSRKIERKRGVTFDAKRNVCNVSCAATPRKTTWWTQQMYVFAELEINGIAFKVIKCDQKHATLEPHLAQDKDDDTRWYMYVRVGESFQHVDRMFRIVSIKRKPSEVEF